MHIRLELSGGLELLFGGQKAHELDLPSQGEASNNVWTVGRLIPYVKDNLLTERPELFMKGNSVRPGILVLINDCDWELRGTLDAALEEGDVVTFISTLHGG